MFPVTCGIINKNHIDVVLTLTHLCLSSYIIFIWVHKWAGVGVGGYILCKLGG